MVLESNIRLYPRRWCFVLCVFTLRGGTVLLMMLWVDSGSGMLSTLFSIWANVSKEIRVGSPSFNASTVEDSGCVNSVTMSVIAC